MFSRIIRFSIAHKLLIFILAFLLIGAGLDALRKLPIDAVPDVTNVQVQVLTTSPGLGPVEVEKFVTFPVESAMSGLPDIEEIRSVSKFGLSVVTVVLEEHVDIYFARTLIQERLALAAENIPEGYGKPEMGPISTGLGEIYQFEVKGDLPPMELRAILDWEIIPRLRLVPGVIEVNPFGGELKTYEVQLDPDRMTAYNLSLEQIFEAVAKNNASTGGGYITRSQEQVLIRGEGLIEQLDDLANIVIATSDEGVPIFIKNVADVRFAPMVRQGAVTRDGRGEVVTGIVMMLIGENSRDVVHRVKTAVDEIRPTLPKGVTIDTFYDRTDLVRKTIRTVAISLAEGGFLVIVILFLMLRSLRAGLIAASAIPLSMLAAFIGMRALGVSGNLMSLGAIDFGLIVDGALIVVENASRHLAEKRQSLKKTLTDEERDEVVASSAEEVLSAAVFGAAIIAVVYLPILSLSGIEGKMFRPMALTVICALAGSFVLSLTLVPALAATFLSKDTAEKESAVMIAARKLYTPAIAAALKNRATTATAAATLLILSLATIPFLGAEFVPRLDEGAIALQAWRVPSVSLEESVRQTTLIEKSLLKKFPEVITVVSKTGRAEIATDPMGVEISDIFVMLKPSDQWTSAKDRETLIAAFDETLNRHVPGSLFSYSQPIELRVSELISGVRSDVAIKVYGEDLKTLQTLAGEIVAVMSKIPGAADVKAEQVAGLPVARVIIDRQAIARYGINASAVLDTVKTIGGNVVGTVIEGSKRFHLQVRYAPPARKNVEQLELIKVQSPSGQLIPLGQLAQIVVEEGPAQISRENIGRRITIEANVRGRDLKSFVDEAQTAIDQKVKIPAGYWTDWGGQFENLAAATERLAIVVPTTLLLIFVLLYTTFRAVRPAVLIFLNIPFAVTGGVLALLVRGMPLSISAGIGFIALFGVAVLNGLVLVSYIRKLRDRGLTPLEAARDAAHVRLRPVLTTALVAAIGFVPMALATGAGAEVQKPLATVVIGGLLTSTLLTMLVLPAIYTWFDR